MEHSINQLEEMLNKAEEVNNELNKYWNRKRALMGEDEADKFWIEYGSVIEAAASQLQQTIARAYHYESLPF